MKVNYKSLKDAQLAELLNEQNKSAFAEVYERYWLFVYNQARRMTKDNDLSQDILQDIFTTLYTKMGVMDFKKVVLPTFLFTQVKHAVISLIRKEAVRDRYVASIKAYIDSKANSADTYVLEKEIQEKIDREIAELPKKMRAIFEMSRKQYLNHKEIAEATNLSVLTVKKQLVNAVRILRSKLTCLILLQLMTAILWINKHVN